MRVRKLRKAIIAFVMSVSDCPHGATRLPLEELWWSLIF